MYKVLSLFVACFLSAGAWAQTSLGNCTITGIQVSRAATPAAGLIALNCSGTPITLRNEAYVKAYDSLDLSTYSQKGDSAISDTGTHVNVLGSLNVGAISALMMHNTAMYAFVKGYMVAVTYEIDPNGHPFVTALNMCLSPTSCPISGLL